jgi:hypothetical protein
MWKVANKIVKIPKEQSEAVIKQMTQRETIMAIVVYVILRLTDSDCPFDIFKPFVSPISIMFGYMYRPLLY